MFWLVRGLVVDMNVGPFHVREALQFRLELFSNVMRCAKGLVGVHHDVDLDD